MLTRSATLSSLGDKGSSFVGISASRNSIGMNSVSVGVIGSEQSNKALFISKFLGMEKFDSIFASELTSQIDSEKASYQLKILTTTGLEDYFFVNEEHIINAQGFIFVYDLYSRESFDYYATFRESLIRLKQTERVPMLMVGFAPTTKHEKEREVSTEEGKKLAELGGFPFKEILGTDVNKISEAFKDVLQEVLTSYVGKSNQTAAWSFDIGSGEIIEMERVPECSILVIGDCFVGKSTLIQQLKNPVPKRKYVSTGSLEVVKHEFNHEKETFSITIMDSPGLWEEKDFSRDEILFVQGLFLVYSVLSRESFLRIEQLVNSILRIVGKTKIPMVLVGSKADLHLEFRNVKYEEGAALAKKLGCPFFEVTFDKRELIVAPFASLGRSIASHLKESSDVLQMNADDLQKIGTLHVSDKSGKKWVPQQFEIHDNNLLCDGKLAMSITGSLSVEIDDSLNAPGRFAFVILGEKKLSLAATTEEERKGWVNSIAVNAAISEITSFIIEEVMHKMLTEHLPKGLKRSESPRDKSPRNGNSDAYEESFSLSSSGSLRRKGLFGSLRRGSSERLKKELKKEEKKSKKG